MTAIMPCPRCGNEAICLWLGEWNYCVQCTSCCYRGRSLLTPSAAIEIWNRKECGRDDTWLKKMNALQQNNFLLRIRKCPFCGTNSQFMSFSPTRISMDDLPVTRIRIVCGTCGASTESDRHADPEENLAEAKSKWEMRA